MIQFYFQFDLPLPQFYLCSLVEVQGQADNLEQGGVKCPWYASAGIAVWMIEPEPSTGGTTQKPQKPSC